MSVRLKYGLIIIFSLVLLLPMLGSMPLFEWLETGYASASKEMVTSGHYFSISVGGRTDITFQPLFIWFQAISMKIFGINEFAARFPNAICGVFTLLFLFYIGKRLVNDLFGLLWALFYATSLIPFYFFRTGLTEPWHNLFMLAGMVCVYEFFLSANSKRKDFYALMAAVCLGLAFLTNGFYSWIVLALSLIVYSIVKMFKVKVKIRHVVLFMGVLLAIGCIWPLVAAFKGEAHNVWAAYRFQIHKALMMNTGRKDFFPFYVILVIVGVFPASILAFNIIKKQRKDDREPLHEFRNWMMILFLVVIGFQLLMRPRLSNYSTFAFIPLTFFATYVVSKLIELKQEFPKWTARFMLLVAVISGTFIISVEVIHYYKDYILSSRLLDNTFVKEVFEANVVVSRTMLFAGLFYISGVLTIFMYGQFSFLTKLFTILGLTILFNYCTYFFAFPHVMEYRQGTITRFFKEKKAEDCYIIPIDFIAYGQFFYGNKTRPASGIKRLYGGESQPDKPLYFIYRSNISRELLDKLGPIRPIRQENGYIVSQKLSQNDQQ
ncbi:MAG TPA: glycosyltransferase family 39 protein [Bacteroidales bacterium]|nr:glycosyltransferase family 39 protein [Bacteroidales bacterium]